MHFVYCSWKVKLHLKLSCRVSAINNEVPIVLVTKELEKTWKEAVVT